MNESKNSINRLTSRLASNTTPSNYSLSMPSNQAIMLWTTAITNKSTIKAIPINITIIINTIKVSSTISTSKQGLMKGETSKEATIGKAKDITKKLDRIDIKEEIITVELANKDMDIKKETITKGHTITIIININIIKVLIFLKKNF